MRQNHRKSRNGATAVEFAIVCPALCFLIFGLLVGGLGVFRYQEIAALARESSRWASVHGAQYQAETGNPAATAADVYSSVIVPRAVGLDLNKLTYSVTWNTDNYPYHTVVINDKVVAVTNTVTVTIRYEWIPEILVGSVNLTSTSETPMSY